MPVSPRCSYLEPVGTHPFWLALPRHQTESGRRKKKNEPRAQARPRASGGWTGLWGPVWGAEVPPIEAGGEESRQEGRQQPEEGGAPARAIARGKGKDNVVPRHRVSRIANIRPEELEVDRDPRWQADYDWRVVGPCSSRSGRRGCHREGRQEV